VSTYSLLYTTNLGAYNGGVLAPNGDIHFVPHNALIGQKINANGNISTYSLVYTAAGSTLYAGGVLNNLGEIHFIPYFEARGQKISTLPVIPFDSSTCQSPWLNKF